MKHFFDTEFIEHAGGIQIVSIGIFTPETGSELYIESTSFDWRLADDWVKENVLRKLEFVNEFGAHNGTTAKLTWKEVSNLRMTKTFMPECQMGSEILEYLAEDSAPEFYAYFASYDWVVFARLFGRLIDKPKNFPMWVIDLKQMMWERGLDKEWKRVVCPDPEGEHNALVDAKWNYELYKKIVSLHIFPNDRNKKT